MLEKIKAFSLFNKKREDERDEEQRELLRSLYETKEDIKRARISFNTATEPELVEASVYEINALQARYAYLLRRLREEGVKDSSQVLR